MEENTACVTCVLYTVCTDFKRDPILFSKLEIAYILPIEASLTISVSTSRAGQRKYISDS